MILYGNRLSPFVRKVLAYGDEKGLSFTLVPGGLGQGDAAFRDASPLGKMPALRDPGADDGRDFTIADSTAIIAYCEARHPEPALIPAAPIARARTVWFEEFADTVLVGAAGIVFFNRFVLPKALGRPGDEAAAAIAERDALPPLYDYLEGVVPAADGFLVGEALTLADLAVASPFVNLAHVGVTVDPHRWPRLVAWLAAIHARPSFAAGIEEERRMVAALGRSGS